ncbi:STAS domain-containing protein [Candidatus Uabimicrobium sp. HlEnr_7]|uniref:STAS domain-containing protein n=1 Tax=Candidatus Uabimicrobium helgolandensis TaxID=3095367 RepID=UPI00355734CF
MFTTETNNDILLITLTVDVLDASNNNDFKDQTSEVVKQQPKVLIDMSALTFIDSSGLGAILSCLRNCNENKGKLKLFAISKTVRTLFELVRMHKVFDIYNTKEEALASFGAK